MRDAMRFYHGTLARMSRRQLLNTAWKLGALAVAQPLVSTRLLAQPLFRAYPFPLGVASGDPYPESVVLWTRLGPEPLDGGGMPAANVEVAWEVSTTETFTDVVRKGAAIARPELGHSVHVEVGGLLPGHDYFYRFRCGAEVSQTGRTKTAPAEGATVDRLRFAVCGCSNYQDGFFAAYRHIADEELDFVFHTGDYIYEGRADGGRSEGLVRQHRGQELYSLLDYRTRYAQYHLDPDLRAAHQSAPFIVSWDDHEVDNDYASAIDERDTPAEVFLLRRAAAYQAYYEMMPVRPSAFPHGPDMRIYRRFRFGSLVDFSVLDTRQYRSDQACKGDTVPLCDGARAPMRTMLGAEQERWLFDHLPTVRARWTVIGQQVPTFARNTAGRFMMDKWDGYVAARTRLYGRLAEVKPPNPIVLSGDVHTHWGADLKRDFANPRSETVGVEFTNTSLSAGGDGTDVQGNWEQIRPDNPHIKYHSARRGYLSCTATSSAMRTDFKILDRVTATGVPVRTGGSLVVEAGRPGCESA